MREMTLFRIYIEDKSHDYEFDYLVKKYFTACTMYPARGMWNGAQENSYIIEYITPARAMGKYLVAEFSDKFCEKYNQECTFITETQIEARYSNED